MERGLVSTCDLLDLELSQGAQSPAELRRLREVRRTTHAWVPMPEDGWTRALDVQAELVASGMARAAGVADLLIAATAELNGLAVLHYDRDFEHIAHITGQSQRWVVPPGTVA